MIKFDMSVPCSTADQVLSVTTSQQWQELPLLVQSMFPLLILLSSFSSFSCLSWYQMSIGDPHTIQRVECTPRRGMIDLILFYDVSNEKNKNNYQIYLYNTHGQRCNERTSNYSSLFLSKVVSKIEKGLFAYMMESSNINENWWRRNYVVVMI